MGSPEVPDVHSDIPRDSSRAVDRLRAIMAAERYWGIGERPAEWAGASYEAYRDARSQPHVDTGLEFDDPNFTGYRVDTPDQGGTFTAQRIEDGLPVGDLQTGLSFEAVMGLRVGDVPPTAK